MTTEQPGASPALSDQLGLVPERAGVLVRLFAWLRGGEVVWILDHEGQARVTIAQMDAFGRAWCPVYWFTKVGRCQLNPDGTVDPRSQSSYVKRWRRA